MKLRSIKCGFNAVCVCKGVENGTFKTLVTFFTPFLFQAPGKFFEGEKSIHPQEIVLACCTAHSSAIKKFSVSRLLPLGLCY